VTGAPRKHDGYAHRQINRSADLAARRRKHDMGWRDNPDHRTAILDACTPEQIAYMDEREEARREMERIQPLIRAEANRVLGWVFVMLCFLLGALSR
jgi:hypothetical protein